jgi:hypothetical protein
VTLRITVLAQRLGVDMEYEHGVACSWAGVQITHDDDRMGRRLLSDVS